MRYQFRMHKIGGDERRARLGLRHHLANEALAPDVTAAAESVLALHATEPGSVFRSAWARLNDVPLAAIEHALYEERSLVRIKAMRGTMFVVPAAQLATVMTAYHQSAARERKRLVKTLTEAGTVSGNVETWLESVVQAALEAVHARGEAVGRELSEDVPELRTSFMVAEGKKWGARQNITTWVLNLLSVEGKIVRARPVGTWASGQYRWAVMDDWLPAPTPEPPSPDAARTTLVHRWLRAFGPGTVEDVRWWTGFTLGQVRKAVAAVDTVEVDLDGDVGVVLADDVDPVPPPSPWVALLPPLDPTAMGWKQRAWYLSEQARVELFDRSGNIGPSVWCNGRIVGGWAQQKTDEGTVAYRLFEDIGAELTEQVAEKAASLQDWHGEVRVAPRGRVLSQLERDLAA
jgi:hypothetical protein